VNFDTTVDIDAPEEIVWKAMSDIERWPEWNTSTTEASWLDGKTMGVGSRARIKQPRMPVLIWEVTELDPGSSFTWTTSTPGISTVGLHVISPVAADRVTVTLGLRQSGILASILGILTAARAKRYVQMEADGLKQRAESTG
jgi:uncharacterized protein YndB with AHSA1/START domain